MKINAVPTLRTKQHTWDEKTYDNEYPPLQPSSKIRSKKTISFSLQTQKGQSQISVKDSNDQLINNKTEKKIPSDVDKCCMSLEELIKIPVKRRSSEQTRRYNQLMYQKRKEVSQDSTKSVKVKDMTDEERKEYHRSKYQMRCLRKTEIEKELEKSMWKEVKAEDRKRKREIDPNAFEESRALEKRTHREKAKSTDIIAFNTSRALEKRCERETAKEKDLPSNVSFYLILYIL